MYFRDISTKIKDRGKKKQIETDGIERMQLWPTPTGDLSIGPRFEPHTGH